MKILVQRDCLDIIPETAQDEVYLATVLGLSRGGDVASAMFIAATAFHLSRVRVVKVEGVN